MNAKPAKWGLVSTIKAPVEDVLNFCAHHLDLGAHRLFIYLDDDSAEHRAAFDLLSAHPKVRPLITDAAYWQKRGFKRREKHQSRQFENAKHVYRRATGQVDWLAHIDVDEFLWPQPDRDKQRIGHILADLPGDCLGARMRPWEALAPLGDTPPRDFKGLSISAAQRRAETAAIYPEHGPHLNGGFLSHVAGKMFYRTGIDGLKVQIHNIWVGDDMNPGQQELPQLPLLHCHAQSWDQFFAAFHFRLEKGSYRSELRPNRPVEEGGVSLHDLLSNLFQQGGAAGLRRFYDAVCVAHPDLLSRLSHYNLHLSADLDLATKRRRHFPTA